MVNLANTVTTSPVKQTQSTGKLININESALLQQARIQRFRYRCLVTIAISYGPYRMDYMPHQSEHLISQMPS